MRDVLAAIRSIIEEEGDSAPLGRTAISVAEALGEQNEGEPLLATSEPAEPSASSPSSSPPAAASGGLTIEDLATQLIKPMLQKWIDDNLHGLVERMVAEEVRRVTRR